MQTSFRNIEISNNLLDLQIKPEDIQKIKDINKKHHKYTTEAEVMYVQNGAEYGLSVVLGSKSPARISQKNLEFYKIYQGKNKGKEYYKVSNVKFENLPTPEEAKYISEVLELFSIFRHTELDKIFKDVDNFKNYMIRTQHGNRGITDGNKTYLRLGSFRMINPDRIKALNWLYDASFDTKKAINTKIHNIATRLKKMDWDAIYLLDVCDIKDNRRLAITMQAQNTYWDPQYYEIILVDHENPAYNYIDKGTYCYDLEKVPGWIQFDQSVVQPPKVFDPLEDYARKHKKDEILVFDQDLIDKQIKKYELKNVLAKKKAKQEQEVRTKISKKIEEIDKTPLKLSDTTFSDKQIEYEGQILKCNEFSIKKVLKNLTRFHELENINYDRAFQNFIVTLVDTILVTTNKKIKATIGDIELELFNKYQVNKSNVHYSIYYVNDIRVNKEELQPILERASCFEDVKTFNSFLKQVSECSLKIHHYLDTGIDITIINPMKHEQISLKLNLIRKDKRQYLKIGKKERLVKNTPRLLTVTNKQYLDDVIELLMNRDVVEGMQINDLKELVIIAKQAYIDAIEKSKLLLERTIQRFNLQKTEVNVSNKHLTGYIVPGKVHTYFVSYENNRHTNDCGVYTYPGMQYVCIVDKSPNQQVGVDKFVNRIYALANDQLLARQISTLQL